MTPVTAVQHRSMSKWVLVLPLERKKENCVLSLADIFCVKIFSLSIYCLRLSFFLFFSSFNFFLKTCSPSFWFLFFGWGWSCNSENKNTYLEHLCLQRRFRPKIISSPHKHKHALCRRQCSAKEKATFARHIRVSQYSWQKSRFAKHARARHDPGFSAGTAIAAQTRVQSPCCQTRCRSNSFDYHSIPTSPTVDGYLLPLTCHEIWH